MKTAAIVVAAGKGTRMKSQTPKVLHKVAKKPMIGHVLDASDAVDPEKTIVIYSHDDVHSYVTNTYPEALPVKQEEQLGTGHAVQQAEAALNGFEGDVVILCGDVPLVDRELVERMVESHRAQEHDVTFVSAFVDDPTGLGRVIRDEAEEVVSITEHKDATPEQRQIDEINTGLYIVKAPLLFSLLNKVNNENASGEYYITDIVTLAIAEGKLVGTFTAEDADALSGVNSRLQLSYMEDLFQNRMREHYLEEGVTMVDPQSVFFAWDTKLGTDVELGPNVQFGEGVCVGDNVNLEGNIFMEETHVDDNSTVYSFSHLSGATIGQNCKVGPFARLRPEAKLVDTAKVGSYVEVKKSTIGAGSAANHLTYVGDATIGENVNIGASTVVANYDGANKHHTEIGDNVFVGSGTTIVAPVKIGSGATTAANSIITKDVDDNILVVSKVNRIDRNDFTRPTKENK